MTKKSLVWAGLFALISVFCLAGLLAAADDPETVVIKDPAFTKYKKGPVTLSHKKHSTDYGVQCKDCHHVYEDGVKTVTLKGDHIAEEFQELLNQYIERTYSKH